jgi:hypothetical protein
MWAWDRKTWLILSRSRELKGERSPASNKRAWREKEKLTKRPGSANGSQWTSLGRNEGGMALWWTAFADEASALKDWKNLPKGLIQKPAHLLVDALINIQVIAKNINNILVADEVFNYPGCKVDAHHMGVPDKAAQRGDFVVDVKLFHAGKGFQHLDKLLLKGVLAGGFYKAIINELLGQCAGKGFKDIGQLVQGLAPAEFLVTLDAAQDAGLSVAWSENFSHCAISQKG